jgi:hypothetical protein
LRYYCDRRNPDTTHETLDIEKSPAGKQDSSYGIAACASGDRRLCR